MVESIVPDDVLQTVTAERQVVSVAVFGLRMALIVCGSTDAQDVEQAAMFSSDSGQTLLPAKTVPLRSDQASRCLRALQDRPSR